MRWPDRGPRGIRLRSIVTPCAPSTDAERMGRNMARVATGSDETLRENKPILRTLWRIEVRLSTSSIRPTLRHFRTATQANHCTDATLQSSIHNCGSSHKAGFTLLTHSPIRVVRNFVGDQGLTTFRDDATFLDRQENSYGRRRQLSCYGLPGADQFPLH